MNTKKLAVCIVVAAMILMVCRWPSRGAALINVGASTNDHTGDPLRTAFLKHNTNALLLETNYLFFQLSTAWLTQNVTTVAVNLNTVSNKVEGTSNLLSAVAVNQNTLSNAPAGYSNTVASATASGTPGMIRWDTNAIYICTTPNVWRRIWLTNY